MSNRKFILGAIAGFLASALLARADVSSKANANLEKLQFDASNNVKTTSGAAGATTNVNVEKVGGTATATGAGATNAGTQRTVSASDDPGVTSLGVIDDWDETDRAKVNPIVGQAGVAGGAGATSASTQRVVLPTDQTAIPVDTTTADEMTCSINQTGTANDVDAVATGTAADGAAVSGNPVRIGGKDSGGNTQDVATGTDGAVLANICSPGTTTCVSAGSSGADNLATSSIVGRMAGLAYLFDGADWDRARGDTTNGLDVDPTRAPPAATIQAEGAGKAADFTLVAAVASTRLIHWSCRESAGSAAVATVILRHDTVATTCDGPAIAYVELAADGSAGDSYADRGLAVASGVCMDVLAGTVDCSVSTVVE